jgi:hypothetical protein
VPLGGKKIEKLAADFAAFHSLCLLIKELPNCSDEILSRETGVRLFKEVPTGGRD